MTFADIMVLYVPDWTHMIATVLTLIALLFVLRAHSKLRKMMGLVEEEYQRLRQTVEVAKRTRDE